MHRAAMPEPPIELESLLARCMGDADFTREMLALFREQAAAHFAALDERFAAGDVDGVRKMTHAIKGSAANLSADPLSRLAAAVELEGKQGRLPTPAAVAELKAEFERVIAYFPTIQASL